MEYAMNAQMQNQLAHLRRLEQEGAIVPGRHIVPGAWFAADTEAGEMDGTFSATPGTLLSFRFSVRRPGRWLSFNLALDGAALTRDHVLGVIVETTATTEVPFRFCIRSGRAGSFIDNAFPESHVAGPGHSRTQVSLLPVQDAPALQEAAPWRNLRLDFTPSSFEFCLHDARFFIAPLGAPAPQSESALPVLAATAG